MKKFLIMAVTAIAVLSGCSSENDITPAGKVFTARFEGVSSRATLNGMTPNWETTDEISINGAIYTPKTAGAQVDLQKKGADAEGDTYTAYFPASISSGTLPSTINETYGKFNMPMYANSTSTNLEFKNLCGVLAITVKSDQIAAVKSIRVSSKNKAVSGAFTVSGNAAVLTDASTVANTVTINYSTAEATTAEGKVFYVAIPAQTYQELKMELSADGTDFNKSMTTKSATNITVASNKIYPITFADNAAPATTGTAKRTGNIDVKWVQLWENGPKFAEYNVGVTDGKAESYGGYYCWGSSIDKDSSGAYKSGTDALTGDDDTATKLWGSAWRMPTKAELDDLLANCGVAWTTVNGVNGRKFTGKGDYASNSVFLPAAGLCYYGRVNVQGSRGYFWSSSPNGSNCAYYLDFTSGFQLVNYDNRYYGYSVRAVLAEE